MKIIGISKKEGNYQGMPYSNYSIYLTSTLGSQGLGDRCEVVKFKSSYLDNYLKEKNLIIKNLIGRDVDVFYDRYGHASDLRFL